MMIISLLSIALGFSVSAHADEAPKLKGGLATSVIEETVVGVMPKLSACYGKEAEKAKKPLAGKVTMKFSVGPDGKVTKAEVQDTTLKNAAVEGCVADTLKGMQFPSPEAGAAVEITFPFVFGPPAKADASPKKKSKK